MLKSLWRKIGFLGITDHDEFKHREVVLMNKLVVLSAALMLIAIPLEVLINGWDLVWIEGLIVLLCISSLLFNYLGWFTFAKFYFFIITSAIIFFLGIAIGKGSANELFFFPLCIFPAMLFKNRLVILILSSTAMSLFLLQNYLTSFIPPTVIIPPNIMITIKYIFAVIVFVIVFFEVYYFKSINYRFQQLLGAKNEEIEHKNREIIDSINYAKRIQEAILLPPDLVKNYLPDSFVVFKPKDIVAGDFYWIEEADEKIIFGVADCTGHGVPGALVSVVCHNALNSSLREFNLTEPGKILDKTRDLVIKQFSKSQQDVKDGMDISLCSLSFKTLTLQWSGANNPLWILRNGATEIEELKPDKLPVGKGNIDQKFTTHTIQLSKGDQLYIFSDGFADQFGGERGKKYKYKPFSDLILANANKSMAEQKELISKEFNVWKRDLEQVDDVCIIGVRI